MGCVAGILTAFSQSRGLVSELIIKLGISDKGVSLFNKSDAYYPVGGMDFHLEKRYYRLVVHYLSDCNIQG